jgi:hypothetical protein
MLNAGCTHSGGGPQKKENALPAIEIWQFRHIVFNALAATGWMLKTAMRLSVLYFRIGSTPE